MPSASDPTVTPATTGPDPAPTSPEATTTAPKPPTAAAEPAAARPGPATAAGPHPAATGRPESGAAPDGGTTTPATTRVLARGRVGWIVRAVALVALAAAVLSFPSLAPNPYILSAGVVVLNYAVLSTSWNFVGGFTGYISLGHGALAGLGGYGTALLVTKAGLPSFVALAVAALLVAVLAVPIGYAALRVRGASFVIVSIALVLILLLVFQSWASLTGGSRGLVVPRPFPGLLRPEHHRVFYFLFAGLLGLALLAWWLIDRSRFGLGLKAIREDEDKAEALGTPTFAYKLVVFVVSAGFTALAGGLYALWFGDLDPVFQFSILTGSYLVLMALLGGVRHLFGPLVGALVVGIALEYFKVEFGNTPLHLVATGVLLALVVLFMPDGVLPAIGALANRLFGTTQSSIREVTAAQLREERTAGARVDAVAVPGGAQPTKERP
ncbi:branched-chain amino acid ABC transporter permease [Micromonospora sp. C28SCA-DRY-2]|uniref:branched-chain amino acid ABC transporter permease n=1 Tax=Micromonospora sp. C28SCA-DRY-2 TaxID=3059522 RepID=UPI0026771FC6|nr:branched-chain amino acid ABC transporter permease [Micromonospora sp. C28SCA-DRY-2]MDO3704355.1 branched-chain amino acid ABC transporter permease [Micromonospora sp. C28SCA-DRY-2]